MTDRFSIYILAEDKRHQSFLRRFLKRAGIGEREMIFAPISDGRGSGKQRVINQFADQVRLCRRRNSRALTSLIAMMDADEFSVDQCLNQLNERLSESGQNRVDSRVDRIAREIPKWNIETWILFLVSSEGDRSEITEAKNLKDQKSKQEWEDLTPRAAEIFWEWHVSPAGRPARVLESITRSLRELPSAVSDGR
jgi:hypothetical protein